MSKSEQTLLKVDPAKIIPNPENPRLIFRERELGELKESIAAVGIQVPLTVYKDGTKYVLVDGERRWRCSRKLNLKEVPVIVLPKPDKLNNLLMMFNIHNVRLDWDLLPMALKLKDIQNMLDKKKKPSSPRDIAAITGVPITTVNRALDVLELPKKYQDMIMEEMKKPRDQQKIKVDLFVEMNKAHKLIEKNVPEALSGVTKGEYIDTMLDKYKKGVVNNVVAFRQLGKIAKSESEGVEKGVVTKIIKKFINDKNYTIDIAYEETIKSKFESKDIISKIKALSSALDKVTKSSIEPEAKASLLKLRSKIDKLIA